jgi:N-acetylneuraminate synthase
MSSIEIIAEIAQAHDGSLGIAHSYIDALSQTGINTVKFQMHIAEAESSIHEQFRIPFSYKDASRYDYWKRMEFSFEEWAGLKAHCEEKGLRFLCSPFSVQAFHQLEQLQVDRYKIASGEVSNYLLLDKISATKKPMLISSGLSQLSDLQNTLEFCEQKGGQVEALFHCTTMYPTPPENYGLNRIKAIQNITSKPIGLSDHSGEIYAGIAAVAMGIKYYETHVVFDKQMFGPDATSSLNFDQLKTLVKGIRAIETAMHQDHIEQEQSSSLQVLFGKSLTYNRDLNQGHTISIDDLESTKPGNMGMAAKDVQSILGKTLTQSVSKRDFVQLKDFNS